MVATVISMNFTRAIRRMDATSRTIHQVHDMVTSCHRERKS